MVPPKNDALAGSERRASLRPRAAKPDDQAPPESLPQARIITNLPKADDTRNAASSESVNIRAETAIASLNRPPRPSLLKSSTEVSTRESSQSSALSSGPPVVIDMINLSLTPQTRSRKPSLLLSASQTHATCSHTHPDDDAANPRPETDSQGKRRQSTKEPVNESAKGTKRNYDEYNESVEDDKEYVICGGFGDDEVKYILTKDEFESILESVPDFKTYLVTSDSTCVDIDNFPGSSLKVIIEWLHYDEVMKPNLRKPGREEGISDYLFVETYIMANYFGLSTLCDEIMDMAMKELWGEKDEKCLLPDIRSLYQVYKGTERNSPLRKLYIAILDWNLMSEECTRLTTQSKIPSPELWDILKSSGYAGVDWINYMRRQVTEREMYFHPIDPKKWNLNSCELHQHAIGKPCPVKQKQEAGEGC